MNSADTALFESIAGHMHKRGAELPVLREAVSSSFKKGDYWTQEFKGGAKAYFRPMEKLKNGGVKGLLLNMDSRKPVNSSVTKMDMRLWVADDVDADVEKTFKKHPKFEEIGEVVDPVADALLIEKAPPGWAGTVKAMKKHMPDDKAFALAWAGHKSGKKPHYKDDGKGTTSDGEPEKKAKYKETAMQEADGDQDDDLKHIADPAKLQKSIEDKLGLSGMKSAKDVLKVISSMYSAKTVPNAVYAAAAGMARAEQRLSASSAKAMNKLSAADVAAAIRKGIDGTKAPTIKNMEKWWTTEIGKLDADRGGTQHKANNMDPAKGAEVQPYIDSMAVESMDSVFEMACGCTHPDQDSQPIGSGALSGPEAIGHAAGYAEPAEMGGNEDLKTEHPITPEAAAAAITDGKPQSNMTARVQRNSPKLPGENRIDPGKYTAEAIQIRPATYKGKEGFKVSGKSKRGHNIKIFVKKRETADKLKASYKRSSGERGDREADDKEIDKILMSEAIDLRELDELDYSTRVRMAEAYDRLVGGAPDLSSEETVDAEAYKGMLQSRHSNSKGITTPIATTDGEDGKVEVNDLSADEAFESVVGAEEERAA